MKKILFTLLLIFTVIFVSADNVRIIRQTPTSITVQQTRIQTENVEYQRVTPSERFNSLYQPGNVGIALHVGYGDKIFGHNIKNAVEPEIGGQLYYNFPAKDKVKFGVAAGFDYGSNGWNFSKRQYWNMRAGIIICKYLGVGYVGGQYFGETTTNWGHGIYGTIYLPFCEWFGLNLDAKYVWGQGGTLGGGIILQINTKQ